MTSRNPPPPRRPGENVEFTFGGRTYALAISRYSSGRPCEVFIFGETFKNSDMDNILHDLGVIVSIALQHGISPTDLAKSLAREHGANGPTPATVVGAALEALVRAGSGA